MMDLLFDIEEDTLPNIDGLSYIADFISIDEACALIEAIGHGPWLDDLKRRVQHYGYKYDYKARAVTNNSYIGELPQWINPIIKRLHEHRIFAAEPDQVIVNEYDPGQGISAHVDCVPCFGETIASLTLGAGATMQFTNVQTKKREELYLQECSLIVLKNSARYEWTHAIPARKSDVVNGSKIKRGRRISLTFRNVILGRE